MIRQLAHVCLLVRDLERSRAFYEDLLGLPQRFRFERDGELAGYYFALGADTFIEVFERAKAQEPAAEPGIHHFCLECDDLGALRERLLLAGVAVNEAKLGADGSWQCWFRDPDGNDLELQQYTAESAQRRGGVVAL